MPLVRLILLRSLVGKTVRDPSRARSRGAGLIKGQEMSFGDFLAFSPPWYDNMACRKTCRALFRLEKKYCHCLSDRSTELGIAEDRAAPTPSTWCPPRRPTSLPIDPFDI